MMRFSDLLKVRSVMLNITQFSFISEDYELPGLIFDGHGEWFMFSQSCVCVFENK